MKDWTLYEIYNPSDALSMYAPDPVTGGVAAVSRIEGELQVLEQDLAAISRREGMA